jgi:hypothetical protein
VVYFDALCASKYTTHLFLIEALQKVLVIREERLIKTKENGTLVKLYMRNTFVIEILLVSKQ